jgi:hypothetical protein
MHTLTIPHCDLDGFPKPSLHYREREVGVDDVMQGLSGSCRVVGVEVFFVCANVLNETQKHTAVTEAKSKLLSHSGIQLGKAEGVWGGEM